MLRANAVLCCLSLLSSHAWAQDFPNRPLRIFTGNAGGGGDVSVRLFGPYLSNNLKQPVIVENRSGSVGVELFTRVPADGYTLLLDGASLWIGPLLRQMPYDVLRDFAPITLSDKSTNVLALHSSVPAGSVKELIALARVKPGSLNYASGAPGSATHLAMELFKSMAGVDIERIAYKGGAEAVKSAFAGETHMTFGSTGSLSVFLKSNKLKALGVASLQPSALAPEIPTIASQGLPGFDAPLYQGLFAPGKTPPVIVRRLGEEISAVLKSEEVKNKYKTVGYEPGGNTPEEFTELIKSEVAKWGKLIKSAGIKAE